jgi:hypothetical protein
MLTRQRGYLLTTADVLWSTDSSGRDWHRVRAFGTVLNLTESGHHLWVQTPGRLWVLAPGSREWIARPLPRPTDNPAQIQFLNRQDGWLVTTQGGAAGAFPIHLWVTETGGRHWNSVTMHGLPYQGTKSPTFVSTRHGWLVGYDALRVGVVQFFQTDSGGSDWSPVPLRLPPLFRHEIVDVAGFHRDGATDAVMLTDFSTQDGSVPPSSVAVTVYHRTAAGAWRDGAILIAPRADNVPTVTWTGSTAWVVNGSQLWRGSAWGVHWRLVRQWGTPVSVHPMDVLTWLPTRPATGFALVGNRMVESKNAGATWITLPF